ncbi:hypothetical protein [Desulfotalea psychrophila]|uniref:Uncharacterized protein n=1 Tax=Desulfotalea psychrophila (strain LSv54 / DSM 12343) TaxID=177439 RepID=Q6AJP7_DESPS|nr:hypothetical protein [Desulfotalea psychrophila]CAG37433.1 unknown protein [Desulfotalea psychrophila LSv54]
MRKLIKAKDAQSCTWDYTESTKDHDIFKISANTALYKQKRIGLALPYKLRHTVWAMAGIYLAFYLFSYPLFDLYKVAMPQSVIKENMYRYDILT